MPTEYFSKWRNKWIKFKNPIGKYELMELKKYHYQLR